MRPTIELSDPRALRAYAHPIRLALIGLLRRQGPQTATQAAAAIGESVASCSFHLRQLHRFGLIEQVEGDHGRQKPWRATALSTSWSSEGSDPEHAAAATLLDSVILGRYHEEARSWLARRDTEAPGWRKAAIGGDWLFHLNLDEFTQLSERLEAMLDEYADRGQPRSEGARAVTLITLGFPAAELGGGS